MFIFEAFPSGVSFADYIGFLTDLFGPERVPEITVRYPSLVDKATRTLNMAHMVGNLFNSFRILILKNDRRPIISFSAQLASSGAICSHRELRRAITFSIMSGAFRHKRGVRNTHFATRKFAMAKVK